MTRASIVHNKGGAHVGPVVDLFAGPGGWDLGGLAHGLDPVGVEVDRDACATRAAAGLRTVRADVTRLPFGQLELDGLIASPPCTLWSNAGDKTARREVDRLLWHASTCVREWSPWPGDPAVGLITEPLRVALDTRPVWIAWEQVPPVVDLWHAYAQVLDAHGYRTWVGILNAADYGVPQTRRRAFLLAHRGRGRRPFPPEPTHCNGGALTMFGELYPWVSMAVALGWDGTAEIKAGPGYDKVTRSTDQPAFTVCASHDNGNYTVTTRGDRTTRGGNRFDADRPSWSLTARARSWQVNTGRDFDTPGDRSTGQTRPLDAPAPTVDGKGRWHVEGDGGSAGRVVLDVRDALVLQSFPRDYPLVGTITSRFRQVGNAVPPVLAAAVLGVLV